MVKFIWWISKNEEPEIRSKLERMPHSTWYISCSILQPQPSSLPNRDSFLVSMASEKPNSLFLVTRSEVLELSSIKQQPQQQFPSTSALLSPSGFFQQQQQQYSSYSSIAGEATTDSSLIHQETGSGLESTTDPSLFAQNLIKRMLFQTKRTIEVRGISANIGDFIVRLGIATTQPPMALIEVDYPPCLNVFDCTLLVNEFISQYSLPTSLISQQQAQLISFLQQKQQQQQQQQQQQGGGGNVVNSPIISNTNSNVVIPHKTSNSDLLRTTGFSWWPLNHLSPDCYSLRHAAFSYMIWLFKQPIPRIPQQQQQSSSPIIINTIQQPAQQQQPATSTEIHSPPPIALPTNKFQQFQTQQRT